MSADQEHPDLDVPTIVDGLKRHGVRGGQYRSPNSSAYPIDDPYYTVSMELAPASSGALLREARRRAHLSQTEVAQRAQVAQSVISAYESGRREPALSTLRRLVYATGHELVLGIESLPEVRPGLPDSPLGRRLRQRRAAVLATAARYGASNLRVFGSVARGDDHPGSDIDLVADLAPGTGLVTLGALERELEELLGIKVDLAPSDSLRPVVRAEVEAESIPL